MFISMLGLLVLILMIVLIMYKITNSLRWYRTDAHKYFKSIKRSVNDARLTRFPPTQLRGEGEHGVFFMEIRNGSSACHTVSTFSDHTGTLKVNKDPVSSPFGVYTILYNTLKTVHENEVQMFAEKVHDLAQNKILY